jgi:hypothetical protein
VFAIAGYLLLTWQLLAICVDSQPKQSQFKFRFQSIDIAFTCLVVGLGSIIMLLGMYIFGVWPAEVLVWFFTIVDFGSPAVVLSSILYFHCKLSGVPNTVIGVQRIKLLSLAAVVWSLARFA